MQIRLTVRKYSTLIFSPSVPFGEILYTNLVNVHIEDEVLEQN